MIYGQKTVLREKTPADAWDDYAWETDPELASLDAAPVVTLPYSEYLLDFTHELRYSSNSGRRFSVDTAEDGEHIGNCSYYNLDRYRAEVEVGIMIGNRDYWDSGYGTDALSALVDHVFRETDVDRIHLKTLAFNTRAQKAFRKCGFTECGNMSRDRYEFTLMEQFRKDWQARREGN